jgi:hypothetical protein
VQARETLAVILAERSNLLLMGFTDFLKSQLIDFVETYKKYFTRTFGIAITYASVCFLIVALLLRFSDFDKTVTGKQISLLSYLFHRYSKASTYSIIDLTKTVFILFVCFFSIGLTRISKVETKAGSLLFKDFLGAVKIKDIFWLLIVFIVTVIIDLTLVRVSDFSFLNVKNTNAVIYIQEICFHLRIYIPLILFALTIWNLLGIGKTKLTPKAILFLYVALWLYNEFAYELSTWIRGHVFGLILMPIGDQKKYYLIESLIGIPLIAFFFLGYHSAMAMPAKFKNSESEAQQPT